MVKLLLVQAAVTLMMTGLIWMVQIVTYPQFGEVGSAEFSNYHERYGVRITWVVMPLMFVELGLALFLAWSQLGGAFQNVALAGLALVLALWAVTFIVQVPQHAGLQRDGWSAEGIRALVLGNWVRTVLWSARSVLVLWWTSQALQQTGAQG